MNLLPEDMIYEIGTFLSRKDFRSLLSTSKKMKYSKYKYQYLNLNKETSTLFASNNEEGQSLRNEVLLQIQNPNKQLLVDFCWCKQITDVSMLGNVHTLILYACKQITDVSMLVNVNTLNLNWCNGITDVSMLGNVHKLDLHNCYRITDVSMLSNVYELNLAWCGG